MGEQYLGEVRVFPYNYAPSGWAQCDGQRRSVTQESALFSVLGTTYGGDGQTWFALPDLRGRTPIHVGLAAPGVKGGQETHPLTINEMPMHTHIAQASQATADAPSPAGNWWGSGAQVKMYNDDQPKTAMDPSAIANAGSNAPHPNLQPYGVVNFCIATTGIYPTRP